MSGKSKVFVVKCGDYAPETVGAAFERLEKLIAGEGVLLPQNSRLLLKPNLLAADPPEKATTTHYEIFKAAAGLFIKKGNTLCYGDSPGLADFEKSARISKIAETAEGLGIPAVDLSIEKEVFFPEGKFCRKFTVSSLIGAGSGIINLPKLKTHGQMTYTGAMKNVFGCVPGAKKPEAHFKMFSTDNFARFLVDLYRLIKPDFTIMDAVIGMEGNGPRNGTPRKLGFIIAGTDCAAIDTICTRIIGLKPENVPMLLYAGEFGAGNTSLENIEVVGDDWKQFIVKDFKNIGNISSLNFINPVLAGYLKYFLINKPAVRRSKCVMCLKCIEECPVTGKAIYRKNGKINYRYDKCIRCFCCQEICPEGAIYVKKSLLWKLLSFGYLVYKKII